MVGRDVARTGRRHSEDVSVSRPRRKMLSVENLIMRDVVKNLSFSVFAGEVTCMAGLIGSGRTEMMKIVAGALKRNLIFGGTIRLDGKPVRYRVPAQAVKDGIVYVTEDRKLNGFFETMSISENIYLGWLAAQTGEYLVKRQVQKSVSQEWLNRLAIRAINSKARVSELSGGNQQKV